MSIARATSMLLVALISFSISWLYQVSICLLSKEVYKRERMTISASGATATKSFLLSFRLASRRIGHALPWRSSLGRQVRGTSPLQAVRSRLESPSPAPTNPHGVSLDPPAEYVPVELREFSRLYPINPKLS